MTSDKSLLNIPEPWFPHRKMGVGGHKRFFELQDILAPQERISPLSWHWLKAALVPGVLAFFPAPLHWVQADFSCSEFRVGLNGVC